METITFKIQGQFIELAQLLKVCGLCETGGHAKLIIKSGEVQVDGQVELRRGCKIRPGQTVRYADSLIALT